MRNGLRIKEIERIKNPAKAGFLRSSQGHPWPGPSSIITQAQNNFALGMVLVLKKEHKIKRKC
jgi:hypothetical protein